MLRGFLAFSALMSLSAIAAVGFLVWIGGWHPATGNSGIEYKDFVSIVLSALSLMIAVLGASIAALAVYGFEVIRKGAYRIASDKAEEISKGIAETTAEAVAARVAQAYLEQAGAGKPDGDDYGKAAGGNQSDE
jgi:hypothetical protein